MKKTSIPTAGILSTGTEILQGLYPDTNGQWLSQRLSAMGIVVTRHVAAPDREAELEEALGGLLSYCDIVIVTGGLGPTEDDLTRQAVCGVLGRDLVEDAKAREMIEARFALRSAPVPSSNRVQCLIPEGARVLHNHWGTAPGFLISGDGKGAGGALSCKWFAALPGPPREMKPMFRKYLEGALARRFGGSRATRQRVLHTFGVSESLLNDLLRPVFDEIRGDEERSVAFLAGQARVDLRLMARAESPEGARRRLEALARNLRRRLPRGCVYGSGSKTLESVVGAAMRRKGLKLALAESCTGGLVAKRLTDVPGSSEFLLEGWVTYTNEAKRARLGVKAATLRRHGAVSPQTAREMALGALGRSGADVAVALTGVAGPGGGTPEKPVGLVWYGLAWREAVRGGEPTGENCLGERVGDARVATFRTCFPSGREMGRTYASHKALDLIRRLLEGLPLKIRM